MIYWHGLAWALTGAGPSGLGTVVAIDPASNRVVIHGIPIRGAPMAIAAGPAGLWAILANRDHTSQQLVHLVLDYEPDSTPEPPRPWSLHLGSSLISKDCYVVGPGRPR